MSDFHVEDSAAVVTITGWVSIVKRWLPENLTAWAPVVSIACGIAYAFAAKPAGPGGSWVKTLVLGAILGLTASGTFSAVKNAAERMSAKA